MRKFFSMINWSWRPGGKPMGAPSQDRYRGTDQRTVDPSVSQLVELFGTGGGISIARSRHAQATFRGPIHPHSDQFARLRPAYYDVPEFGHASLCRSVLIEDIADRSAGST